MGHGVQDSLRKTGTEQENTQFDPCLYFHFSKYLIRKISNSQSLSNDFANLNVLVIIPVFLTQHNDWGGEILQIISE